MKEWKEWIGSEKAPDAGHPMVFDVEFKYGPYKGQQATTWSDWIDWTHVGRFRLSEDASVWGE